MSEWLNEWVSEVVTWEVTSHSYVLTHRHCYVYSLTHSLTHPHRGVCFAFVTLFGWLESAWKCYCEGYVQFARVKLFVCMYVCMYACISYCVLAYSYTHTLSLLYSLYSCTHELILIHSFSRSHILVHILIHSHTIQLGWTSCHCNVGSNVANGWSVGCMAIRRSVVVSRYGMVWYGMIWYGMVWYSMV